ncbi:unnamed protein product [Tuwongella immobilis]|uniref:Uncharacterized protein n=1 Tax=Tuwongella immobilis TaxID=692036 RepID=A0A6C2YSB0_9BACT|nr:unnamed protein product [Tuwongella immobilis]VTS05413.1 unnamed protein product [Tuwongella immobilis]
MSVTPCPGAVWDPVRGRCGTLSGGGVGPCLGVVWDPVPRPGQGTWKPLGEPRLRSGHFSGRSVDYVIPLTPKNARRGGPLEPSAIHRRWLTPRFGGSSARRFRSRNVRLGWVYPFLRIGCRHNSNPQNRQSAIGMESNRPNDHSAPQSPSLSEAWRKGRQPAIVPRREARSGSSPGTRVRSSIVCRECA